MRILIAGDNELAKAKVRDAARHNGFECDDADVTSLGKAAERAGHARHDFVVVILTRSTEEGLDTIREISSTSHAAILAVGPTNDSDLILRAMRDGAVEYVGEAELTTQLKQAILRLEARQHPRNADGKVIAVVSPSGGTGASTLAANLAACLAKSQETCALVDMRLEAADQNVLLDLKSNHTFADLSRNADRMDQRMFEQALAKHDSGIHLLGAPGSYERAADVTSNGVRKALFNARCEFPFTVVDADNTFAQEQVAALVQADHLLLVLRLEMTSLATARRMLDEFAKIGIGEDRVTIVVGRHGEPKQLSVARAEQALGLPIEHCIPDDAKRVNASNNKGVPFTLEYPRSKASKAVADLAAAIEKAERKESDKAPEESTKNFGMKAAVAAW